MLLFLNSSGLFSGFSSSYTATGRNVFQSQVVLIAFFPLFFNGDSFHLLFPKRHGVRFPRSALHIKISFKYKSITTID